MKKKSKKKKTTKRRSNVQLDSDLDIGRYGGKRGSVFGGDMKV